MPTPTTSPWDHLYNDIKIAVPGVTDAVTQQVLFQIVKDFTDKTNIWTEDVPIPVLPNTLVYQFTVADKGTANRLMLLYDPSQNSPAKNWVMGAVQMPRPGVIILSYPPSSGATWSATVAKTPIDPTTPDKFPDLGAGIWIVDKYRDALMYGVMGRLMMMGAKSFSNPTLGKQNYQNYIAERSKARVDSLHSNTYGGQRWVFPQAWATPHRGGWV